MNPKKTLFTFLCVLIFMVGHGQSTEEEVQKLKSLLKECEEQTKRAELVAAQAKLDADRRRYLSIARSIAEKSLEVKDTELSTLLALQAYNFNLKYQGYQFENRIHQALLSAFKRNGLQPKELDLPSLTKNETKRAALQDKILDRILFNSIFKAEVISFSQSGKYVAIACSDLVVRIWNLNALNQQPLIIRDSDKIKSISFSTNDLQLILYAQSKGSKSEMTKTFPLDFAEIANELCTLTKRNLTTSEWYLFIAEDLPMEKTCSGLPFNK